MGGIRHGAQPVGADLAAAGLAEREGAGFHALERQVDAIELRLARWWLEP